MNDNPFEINLESEPLDSAFSPTTGMEACQHLATQQDDPASAAAFFKEHSEYAFMNSDRAQQDPALRSFYIGSEVTGRAGVTPRTYVMQTIQALDSDIAAANAAHRLGADEIYAKRDEWNKRLNNCRDDLDLTSLAGDMWAAQYAEGARLQRTRQQERERNYKALQQQDAAEQAARAAAQASATNKAESEAENKPAEQKAVSNEPQEQAEKPAEPQSEVSAPRGTLSGIPMDAKGLEIAREEYKARVRQASAKDTRTAKQKYDAAMNGDAIDYADFHNILATAQQVDKKMTAGSLIRINRAIASLKESTIGNSIGDYREAADIIADDDIAREHVLNYLYQKGRNDRASQRGGAAGAMADDILSATARGADSVFNAAANLYRVPRDVIFGVQSNDRPAPTNPFLTEDDLQSYHQKDTDVHQNVYTRGLAFINDARENYQAGRQSFEKENHGEFSRGVAQGLEGAAEALPWCLQSGMKFMMPIFGMASAYNSTAKRASETYAYTRGKAMTAAEAADFRQAHAGSDALLSLWDATVETGSMAAVGGVHYMLAKGTAKMLPSATRAINARAGWAFIRNVAISDITFAEAFPAINEGLPALMEWAIGNPAHHSAADSVSETFSAKNQLSVEYQVRNLVTAGLLGFYIEGQSKTLRHNAEVNKKAEKIVEAAQGLKDALGKDAVKRIEKQADPAAVKRVYDDEVAAALRDPKKVQSLADSMDKLSTSWMDAATAEQVADDQLAGDMFKWYGAKDAKLDTESGDWLVTYPKGEPKADGKQDFETVRYSHDDTIAFLRGATSKAVRADSERLQKRLLGDIDAIEGERVTKAAAEKGVSIIDLKSIDDPELQRALATSNGEVTAEVQQAYADYCRRQAEAAEESARTMGAADKAEQKEADPTKRATTPSELPDADAIANIAEEAAKEGEAQRELGYGHTGKTSELVTPSFVSPARTLGRWIVSLVSGKGDLRTRLNDFIQYGLRVSGESIETIHRGLLNLQQQIRQIHPDFTLLDENAPFTEGRAIEAFSKLALSKVLFERVKLDLSPAATAKLDFAARCLESLRGEEHLGQILFTWMHTPEGIKYLAEHGGSIVNKLQEHGVNVISLVEDAVKQSAEQVREAYLSVMKDNNKPLESNQAADLPLAPANATANLDDEGRPINPDGTVTIPAEESATGEPLTVPAKKAELPEESHEKPLQATENNYNEANVTERHTITAGQGDSETGRPDGVHSGEYRDGHQGLQPAEPSSNEGNSREAGHVRLLSKAIITTKDTPRTKGWYHGEICELQNTPEAAQHYISCLTAAKESRGIYGECVDVKTPEEYAHCTMLLTPDGKAGVVIKPDGDLVSVFSHKGQNLANGKAIPSLIAAAVEQGKAIKADCYGKALANLYGKYGFKLVAKDHFNEEYASGAMKDAAKRDVAFSKDNGTPDVYYLVWQGDRAKASEQYDPKFKQDYDSVEYASGKDFGGDTYEECLSKQSAAVDAQRSTEKSKSTFSIRESKTGTFANFGELVRFEKCRAIIGATDRMVRAMSRGLAKKPDAATTAAALGRVHNMLNMMKEDPEMRKHLPASRGDDSLFSKLLKLQQRYAALANRGERTGNYKLTPAEQEEINLALHLIDKDFVRPAYEDQLKREFLAQHLKSDVRSTKDSLEKSKATTKYSNAVRDNIIPQEMREAYERFVDARLDEILADPAFSKKGNLLSNNAAQEALKDMSLKNLARVTNNLMGFMARAMTESVRADLLDKCDKTLLSIQPKYTKSGRFSKGAVEYDRYGQLSYVRSLFDMDAAAKDERLRDLISAWAPFSGETEAKSNPRPYIEARLKEADALEHPNEWRVNKLKEMLELAKEAEAINRNNPAYAPELKEFFRQERNLIQDFADFGNMSLDTCVMRVASFSSLAANALDLQANIELAKHQEIERMSNIMSDEMTRASGKDLPTDSDIMSMQHKENTRLFRHLHFDVGSGLMNITQQIWRLSGLGGKTCRAVQLDFVNRIASGNVLKRKLENMWNTAVRQFFKERNVDYAAFHREMATEFNCDITPEDSYHNTSIRVTGANAVKLINAIKSGNKAVFDLIAKEINNPEQTPTWEERGEFVENYEKKIGETGGARPNVSVTYNQMRLVKGEPLGKCTKLMLLDFILRSESGDYYTNNYEPWGYTQDVLNRIRDIIYEGKNGEVLREYGEFMRDNLNNSERQRLYAERNGGYGMNLAENYWPGHFMSPAGIKEEMDAIAAGGHSRNTVLRYRDEIPRVTHDIKPTLQMDAESTFHMERDLQEYYIAFSEVSKEMRDLYTSDSMMRALTRDMGAGNYKKLLLGIDALDGIHVLEQASRHGLSRFIQRLISSKSGQLLDASLSVWIKQLSGILNAYAYEDISMGDVVAELLRFAGTGANNMRGDHIEWKGENGMLNWDCFKDRSIDHDAINALFGQGEGHTYGGAFERLADRVADVTADIDKISNAFGSYMLANCEYRRLKREQTRAFGRELTEDETNAIRKEVEQIVTTQLELSAQPMNKISRSLNSLISPGVFLTDLTFMGGEVINKIGIARASIGHNRYNSSGAHGTTYALSKAMGFWTSYGIVDQLIQVGIDFMRGNVPVDDKKDLLKYIAFNTIMAITNLGMFERIPFYGQSISSASKHAMGLPTYGNSTVFDLLTNAGAIKAFDKFFTLATDDEEHSAAEWGKAVINTIPIIAVTLTALGKGGNSPIMNGLSTAARIINAGRNAVNPVATGLMQDGALYRWLPEDFRNYMTGGKLDKRKDKIAKATVDLQKLYESMDKAKNDTTRARYAARISAKKAELESLKHPGSTTKEKLKAARTRSKAVNSALKTDKTRQRESENNARVNAAKQNVHL